MPATRLGAAVIATIIIVTAGCVGPGVTSPSGASSQPEITPSTPTPSRHITPTSPMPSDRPVDPSVVPVSRSAPTADAQRAMEACQLSFIGYEKVGGMGLISSASRAHEYAPLTGREPELLTNEPAWMVQFVGEVPQPFTNEVWIDPICVVIDRAGGFHAGGFYATGPVRMPTGAVFTPEPVPVPPRLSLPPLAP